MRPCPICGDRRKGRVTLKNEDGTEERICVPCSSWAVMYPMGLWDLLVL